MGSWKALSTFCLVLVLSGCGGSGSDTGSGAEVLYLPDTNIYFSVDSSGYIEVYKCSVSDGYVVDETVYGYKEGNVLSIIYEGASSGEDYIVSVEEDALIYDDDAIEITSYTPVEVEEGVEAEFVVSFNYRLVSLAAVVEIGFTSNENGTVTIESGVLLEIDDPEVSSGVVSVRHVPVSFGDSTPVYLEVYLNPLIDGGPYFPFASDRRRVFIE